MLLDYIIWICWTYVKDLEQVCVCVCVCVCVIYDHGYSTMINVVLCSN